MKKTIGVILALSCAGFALAVSVARPASTDGTLQANVGPGYTITLTQNGTKVSSLAPGTYSVDVTDQAVVHDFHLVGPGVDQATSIEGTGTTTWTVTFTNGTYQYFCDAHPTIMKGSFTVGTAPPATTTTTTTTPPPPPPLKVRATAKAVAHVVTVKAIASRTAALDFGLWKGTKRVAHRTAKAKVKTVRLTAPAAGRYLVKVVAKAGGKTAKAGVRVNVK
jgi:hypothetical protein